MNSNGNMARLADDVHEIAQWGRGGSGGGTWEGRPPPTPPSCFSELYRLNQCYDDVVAMKQILTKVMTDLLKSDPSITQAIIDQIMQSGSTVPTIGVTDGSDAQPGQVGEFKQFTATGTVPGTSTPSWQTTSASVGVLPPGDWNVFGAFNPQVGTEGNWYQLDPVPAGFSNPMNGGSFIYGQAAAVGAWSVSQTARALLAVPTLLAFQINIQTVQPTPWMMVIEARRMR